MATMDELIEKVHDIARREHRSAEAVLADMIYRCQPRTPIPDPEDDTHPNGLLRFAEAAEAQGLSSDRRDISERSREFLDDDLPEHLMRRMHGDDNAEWR